MKLPNSDEAVIAPAKLKDYILAELHPEGGPKARFFRSFGFDESNLDILEQGLLAIVQAEEVRSFKTSPHGTKYVIRGQLQTPVGRTICVDTVWIIDTKQRQPRFVTAYPA